MSTPVAADQQPAATPLPSDYRIVDLTQEIYEGMPVYDIFIPTKYFPVMTYESIRAKTKDHWVATAFGLLMCDHSGTHVDSISHIDDTPGALTIDQFPVERFITSAICLDVSHVQLPDFYTAEVLAESAAKAGLDVRQGDTVLLRTGHYERYYPQLEYMGNHTGLDRSGMEWLADRGAVNVGVDSPAIESVLRMGTADPSTMPAHRVCLERGLNNTENLCNLGEVAGQRFVFIGLPLPIRGGSGSPIRAIALVAP
jgi:kynurenine formamidase